MTLRIASTQPAGAVDPRENGRSARELMRVAAADNVRLVQFPEGFLSGYAKEQVADWSDVDWPAVREEIEEIAALAAQLRIWVVMGSGAGARRDPELLAQPLGAGAVCGAHAFDDLRAGRERAGRGRRARAGGRRGARSRRGGVSHRVAACAAVAGRGGSG
ncbi:nitrilase-related carbon-nitrogen hydrolase [Dactylosporangium sp. CS-047395]|uniref:nitrilase-related carbon-nitrogen hydrolase n=1 Tax=Dactylosporangium sp. CS-047395 TaxID=3239936 RepID=UPI003D933769